MTRPRLRICLVCVLMLATACVEHLPDQDLRILTAVPAAKLSVADLWQDFQRDPAAATSPYFGKAVDISGKITSVESSPAKAPHVFFGQAGERGIRAYLLEDQTAQIVKNAIVGERFTLRCFCEGLDEQRDVVLKSCIRP